MRWSSGSLPTDRQFTGQRREAALGIYDYRARFYSPRVGRFLSADTLVPEPGNPQALNRYSYCLGDPVKYTDPTGHFEVNEIERYLEFQLGITDPKERDRIIKAWQGDTEWWAIIGPGHASYGDILDGTKLDFLGRPGNRVQGQFLRDEQNDTFTFVGKEYILEMPGDLGCWDIQWFDSLVEFHNEARDIVWMRHDATAGWVYQGGTGYGADGAPVRWNEVGKAVKHGVYALGFGLSGIAGLAAPEPTLLTKALAVVAFVKYGDELWQVNEASAKFARSVDTALRLRDLQGQ